MLKNIPSSAVFLIFAQLLLPVPSVAQVTRDLSACMAIDDDAARLACFDRAARNEVPSTKTTEAAKPSAQSPEKIVAEKTEAESLESSVPAVNESEPAGAPLAVGSTSGDSVPAADDQDLGAGDERPPAARDDFTAVVVEVVIQPRGEHTVILDNGQVWQENFASRYFPVEPGDEIRIRKRLFSGFRLVSRSGKSFNVGRVR